MQLSWHFTLDDLTRSGQAERLGIDNTPGPKEVENLKRLCDLLLEPVWSWCGSLYVSSGYRSKELNRAVGGVDGSDHTRGVAVDFICLNPKFRDPYELARFLSTTKTLPFDQLGNEYGRWVHCSIPDKKGDPILRRTFTKDHQGRRDGIHPARPKLPPKGNVALETRHG